MLQYLNSPEGARYITFQNELKSISNQALDSLMAQEPITGDEPTEVVLKRRQQLLALGFDARFRDRRRAAQRWAFGSGIRRNPEERRTT